ncbi:MAG: N-acetylmuramoyl-L-alanine amidase [Actinomycetia bacterium]|nr:N-acetylmuramoyl-L-alanine amidase [Actinomycetes bacterium]
MRRKIKAFVTVAVATALLAGAGAACSVRTGALPIDPSDGASSAPPTDAASGTSAGPSSAPPAAPSSAQPTASASAKPAGPSNQLALGESLAAGHYLVSAGGAFRFIVQSDGNLIIRHGSQTIWSSRTSGHKNARLTLQSDGNLVLRSATGKALWSTRTGGKRGFRLVMKSNGDLVCYTKAGKAAWASHTVARRAVVFLDPGHGANVAPTAATSGGSKGIYSGENGSGGNEDADMYTVARRAQTILRKAGYTVVLSRTGNPDPARRTLWQKGLLAERANKGRPADIAVSLHTDVKANVGAGQIYYDNMGGYRQNNAGSLTRYFTNKNTASLSRKYALIFQKTRQKYQHAPITVTAGHGFAADRNLGSHGTIPIVMLTAQDVPWVYNEMGRTTSAGLSAQDLTVYANSIVAGVEQSVPPIVYG